MVDEMDSLGGSEQLEKIPQSDSKVIVGAKRDREESEESDLGRKQAKMKDLQSVVQSEGIDTYDPETYKMEEIEGDVHIVETQGSQVLDKNAVENAETRHLERIASKSSTSWLNLNASKPLDLNSEVCTDENSGYNGIVNLGDGGSQSSYGKGKAVYEHKNKSSTCTRLDLNAEDVASSAVQDRFYAYKSHAHTKIRETLECGRTNRLDKKDALRKWNEMKQNGFISPTYGGIPAAPKQRGRKSKADLLKQKMEQAKKEQVDRFTKIAAPSGLLNGLNPGIINHVRNSKQVHSIIQALVRSEKRESRKQAIEGRAGSRDIIEKGNEQENVSSSRLKRSILSYNVESFRSMPEKTMLPANSLSHNSSSFFSSENIGGSIGSAFVEGRSDANAYVASHSKNRSMDGVLALKLSSSNMVSESTSCLSNDESENVNSVDTLSVKAASVASQWLQLLQQDIKGRLAALRRSKKRVHAVITTELPFLLSKEFSFNQENDPCHMKDSAFGCPNKAGAELHKQKWSKLFHQMDTTLSEEEKQLECWLDQVDKMQLHCDQGLQHVHWSTLFEMQHFGAFDNELRSKFSDPEKDLSVRAAAASIYSTCNFLSSRENVSCC